MSSKMLDDKEKRRILVITDSLALPRPQINELYQDTCLYFLERHTNGTMWVLSQGGISIKSMNERLINLAGYLEDNIFDLCILELGLVDCAPRPVQSRMKERNGSCGTFSWYRY